MCDDYYKRDKATAINGHASVQSCKQLCDSNVRPRAFPPLLSLLNHRCKPDPTANLSQGFQRKPLLFTGLVKG
jgi:hypothetical protein